MRKTYLDNIRWITVCLVVVYHVLFIFSTLTPLGLGTITETTYQDAVLYLLYPWFMLLLFVVSGMCARFYLQNHSDRTFRKARTTKLLVPSTLGLLVFGWVLGYVNTRIGGGFDSLKSVPALIRYLIMCLSGSGVLWYVQTLWLFSMVLIPVRRLEKDRLWNLGGKMNLPGLLLLTIAVWGASRILNTPIIVVYRFGIYGLGFFLGYQAARLLKADFPTAVTMSLNSGIRNIAAGSVLAIQYFPGDVLFPVAFSPLFLQATTAVIVKILHATKGGKEFDRQAESAK